MSNPARAAAEQIAALINSRVQSPRTDEMETIIARAMPTNPLGQASPEMAQQQADHALAGRGQGHCRSCGESAYRDSGPAGPCCRLSREDAGILPAFKARDGAADFRRAKP
jgi:hypothetical protein